MKAFQQSGAALPLEPLAPALAEVSVAEPVMFGDYLLEEELGHGGMGVVYCAWQLSLNRTVAVKLLLLGKYSSTTSRSRLVKMHVAAGTRLVADGLAYEALLYFAETLRLDAGHSDQEKMHRRRFGAVLRTSPRLVGHRARRSALRPGDGGKSHARWIEHRPVSRNRDFECGERAAQGSEPADADGNARGVQLPHPPARR